MDENETAEGALQPPVMQPEKLRDKILVLTACSVRSSRTSIQLLQYGAGYTDNMLTMMRRAGEILTTAKRPWSARLTEKVYSRRDDDPLLGPYLHFYGKYSNSNNPGSSPSHKTNQLRASDITAMCMNIGILIGPQKPAMPELLSAPPEGKLDCGTPVLYLLKELRTDENQQVFRRGRVSRATAIILSPGFNGLVYHCGYGDFDMNGRAERETVRDLKTIRRQLVVEPMTDSGSGTASLVPSPAPPGSVRSIVFAPKEESDDLVTYLLTESPNTRDRKKPKTKQEPQNSPYRKMRKAVWSPQRSGAEVHILPVSTEGITRLAMMTHLTERDVMLRLGFSAEETAAGAENCPSPCDALRDGTMYYEFLDMNASKLARLVTWCMTGCRDMKDRRWPFCIICSERQEAMMTDIIPAVPAADYSIRTLSEEEIENLTYQ